MDSIEFSITEEECQKILQEHCSNKTAILKNFSVEPFAKHRLGAENCDYHKLKLQVEMENNGILEIDFLIKVFTKRSVAANLCEISLLFQKELFVFEFFKKAQNLDARIKSNSTLRLQYHNSECIIIENMEKSGYKKFEGKSLDKEHLMVALKTLATFHAASILYEEIKKSKLNQEFSKELQEIFFSATSNFTKYSLHGFLAIAETLPQFASIPDIEECVTKSFAKYNKLFCESNNFRNVISHGDIGKNNILFSYKNNKPVHAKLVDFQMIRYAPPAHDLTLLISNSNSRNVLKEYIHEFYAYYYYCLKKELAIFDINILNVLPKQEYRETCNIYMAAAKFITVIYNQITCVKRVENNPGRLNEILITPERVKFVKINLKNDPQYKKELSSRFHDYLTSLTDDNRLVSVEDCYKTLSIKYGHYNFDLVSYKLDSAAGKGGFLGNHFYLKTRIQSAQIIEDIFFIKMTPVLDVVNDFAATSVLKEELFFSTILPAFRENNITIVDTVVPKCYITEAGYFVFDDLSTLGYDVTSMRHISSIEHIQLVLTALAKLHASGYIYEELMSKKLEKLIRLNQIWPKSFAESFYNSNATSLAALKAAKTGFSEQIKQLSNYTSSISPKQFEEIGFSLFEDFQTFVQPSEEYRNTICHGDIWKNNIMFKNDEKCFIIDFQSYRYKPPFHDVMLFIYLVTDQLMREKYLNYFLEFYYNQLDEVMRSYDLELSNLLTKSDFLIGCGLEKPFTLAQIVLYIQVILMSKEDTAKLFADQANFLRNLFGDRTEMIRTCCENDEVYKKRSIEIIEEFRSICEEIALK